MTPRQLADLAAVVSRHAEAVSAAGRADTAALHRVWKRASRCTRTWREELVASATPRLYAELFSAELPLRTWCTAIARAGRGSAGAAVAGKVFGDLLELRCMALQALAADHGLSSQEAASLDRFRRRCERWTDVLLGPLVSRTGLTDFAVRPDRAADYGSDAEDAFESSWPLMLAGLRLAFATADDFRDAPIRRDAGAVNLLAAAIAATLPSAAFDSAGRLVSPPVARAARVVDERRPAKLLRSPSSGKSAAAPKKEPAPAPPRPAGPISFVSLRKDRPAGS